jgi:hypothetical protein
MGLLSPDWTFGCFFHKFALEATPAAMRYLKELAEQFLGTASGLRYHLVLRTLEGLLFRVFQELS